MTDQVSSDLKIDNGNLVQPWVTLDRAAKYFSISKRQIYSLMSLKLLEYLPTGIRGRRVRLADVEVEGEPRPALEHGHLDRDGPLLGGRRWSRLDGEGADETEQTDGVVHVGLESSASRRAVEELVTDRGRGIARGWGGYPTNSPKGWLPNVPSQAVSRAFISARISASVSARLVVSIESIDRS